MNTLNIANCSVAELSHDDMISIEGGGILEDFLGAVKAAGKAIGYGIGYAAGAVCDAVAGHGADVAESGGAAASLAYK
jgi:hypothetical protein